MVNIIGKTIARMQTDFGCNPGNILAGVDLEPRFKEILANLRGIRGHQPRPEPQ